MSDTKAMIVDSPIGRHEIDRAGAPVGVVRMDLAKSYAGIGGLLQKHINDSDPSAWDEIKARIDYTYESLDLALAPLAAGIRLQDELLPRLKKGQKLFFKPNLVVPGNIDPQTHGPDRGSTTCTEWAFIAALMRWFHDKMGISYHQMALGEAATAVPATASQYSMLHPDGGRVTPEAVIEGKSGDFYGGWGFYFARQYLAETLEPGRRDDPMRGHEESVSGTYLAPGYVTDKLMVYDLNRIFDHTAKGRNVAVPDGVNFKSITLHKVVVGGDPAEPEDRRAYPGCILVNVPKFKVHAITLFTNVIKNLGIGLYPMQSAETDHPQWDYSFPHTSVPAMKATIPHQVWVPDTDLDTGLPKRDGQGNYMVGKTGGITATMVDIIRAVQSQGIFMLHVVDGIETINLDHTGALPGTREPEGIVFAGVDPVATDLLCARYMFSNVPLQEAEESGIEDGHGGCFPQSVPLPRVQGHNIVSEPGYDCPLARDICFQKAEERGLGERRYHVVGRDAVTDHPLVSLRGHLGAMEDGTFVDRVTQALYFDAFKMPWDLQQTIFRYFDAVDELAGSTLKRDFLAAFDETGDGAISYEEFGTKGIFGPLLHLGGDALSRTGTEPAGYVAGPFISTATMLKCTQGSWNAHGHDLLREYYWGRACVAAYQMSQMAVDTPDLFLPTLTWGNGKWPSFQLVWHIYLGFSLYGGQFPNHISFPSLYAFAFRHADVTQNGGRYAGTIRSQPRPEAVKEYVSRVLSGQEEPMDFTFYVPESFDNVGGSPVPNVKVTADPGKLLTASFSGGQEVWGQAV